MRREIKFLIIASTLGIIFLALFIWFLFSRSLIPSSFTALPTPTPVPNIFYNESVAKKTLDLVQKRSTPSPSDATARTSLLARTNNETGTIFQSDSFSLIYLKTPDLFQAEILIPDIAKAKSDATSWLKSQGLSTSGICHLPLTFYLSQNVSNSLLQKNQAFDPLPPGC